MATERSSPSFIALPAWVLLLDRWKAILGVTILAGMVAFGGSYLIPQTYRVRSSLFVLPPASAENLKLPPDTIHVSTLQTLAMSPSLLEALIVKIEDQHILVDQVEAKIRSEGGEVREETWRDLLEMGARVAADYLGAELNDTFVTAWEDLPPAELIEGYHDFEEDAFKDKDALALSERLSAAILTSLETNVTTDFQPILNLEVEWESKRSAALIADVWARTISRYSDRIFLAPTLELQTHRKEQLVEFEKKLSEIGRRRANRLSETDLEATETRLDSILEELYGEGPEAVVAEASPTVSTVAAANASEASLLRNMLEARVRRESLDTQVRDLQAALDLLEKGGDWIGTLPADAFLADSSIQERFEGVRRWREGENVPALQSLAFRILENLQALKEALASPEKAQVPTVSGMEATLSDLESEYQVLRAKLQSSQESLVQARGESELLDSRLNRLQAEAIQSSRTLAETRAVLKGLDAKQETVRAAYQRVLNQGGLEARVTDFNEVLRLRKSPSPMLPEKPYRPRHWLFGSIAGLLALVLSSCWIVLRNRYALARGAGTPH